MNILLIGGAGSFTGLLVDKLDKEGHRIFLLTQEPKKGRGPKKIFETYYFSYRDACVREVFESIRPDIVLFLGAYDLVFSWDGPGNTAADYIAGLTNVLMAFAAGGTGRFLYLSSELVFQKKRSGEVGEEEPCAADTAKGQAVAIGEGICESYRRMGSDTVVLRLEHLYGTPHTAAEADAVCAGMCVEALETGEITAADGKYRLLHMSDAVEFIYQVMCAGQHEYGIYHISSGEAVSGRRIAELIAEGLGDDIPIAEASDGRGHEVMLSGNRFREEFGIRIMHKPEKEIPAMAEYIKRHKKDFIRTSGGKRSPIERLREESRGLLSSVIPFLENLVCFIPFFMLNNRAVGSEYFQNIDFYLLYVLLFAIVYGQQQAAFSALLAVFGYCFRQMYHRSGFEVMLDYNTYVWIAQIFILGLVVGYMKDRLKSMQEEEKHEVSYLSKQIEDISEINLSNVRVKEILSDQLVNQNDSFGKLYEITSSLDKYEPGEVLFYAAEVLSKLMGSRDVAIYTVANRSYARLFSATSKKARSMGNSIHYVEMEELYASLKEKKVFINKSMDERYPLMANAIYSEDEMQLILMVWGIPWERMTLGQANMLTVIGYLIQNAVLRANRYISALEQQRYIEGTNILGEASFRSLVKAYLNARGRELTECALIRIDAGDMPREEAGRKLAAMLRQSDFIGELKDGQLYALLANTNSRDAVLVEKRFSEAGFACLIQEDMAV